MTMRVGLVGGGSITGTHARAVSAIPGAEVAAIYGTNLERVDSLARQFGATAYTDFHEFLSHRPMEMVVIGSPSGLHAQQGIAAARQGLHVLVEKPIDINTTQVDALISACEHAKVKLAVIFQDRFKPDLCRLRQLIAEGTLGKPLLADARVKWYRPPEYYSGSRWRGTWRFDGGGALMNQGVHTVDLLLWLLGDVREVQARTATMLHSIQAEDMALALLEFASGALGVLQATTAAYPGYARRVEITGSEGTMAVEGDQIVAADLRHPVAGLVRPQARDRSECAASPVVSDVSGHQSVIEDFLCAIRENRAPACDGREARRSVALIEEIYQASARSDVRTSAKPVG